MSTTERNRGEIIEAGKWNPTEHRFRLTVTRQSSQRGCFGWKHDISRMFKTLDEAVTEAKLGQGSGVISVSVDEAMNAETWTRNGSWKRRFYRRGRGK